MRETFLPFSMPSIGEEEIAEVVDSLRSGWITTGPKVKRFEEQFRDYIGAKHAIAVNSCTAALHIALAALGVGPGHEVIVPTFTFCSTANVVVHLGARPILVDVYEDFNISPNVIEKAISPRTRAIIPVHYGGQPCDLDLIYDIAACHNLAVVEDAAHAIGANYRGYKIGSDSLRPHNLRNITCFSFYATKNMTTGEGGMITTNDDELAEQMRLLSLHGMTHNAWKRYTNVGSWYYEILIPGYKYNMTDIQASLGIHQLKKLNDFIISRQRIAKAYNEAFKEDEEIITPIVHNDRSHVYHLYVIRLKLDLLQINRDQFVNELKALKIGASVHFIPVHFHPFYSKKLGYKRGYFPVAEKLYGQVISLPIYPKMTEGDIIDVIETVKEIIKRNRK